MTYAVDALRIVALGNGAFTLERELLAVLAFALLTSLLAAASFSAPY
jgi:hypothetical protein